jgi:hypothetical protein
MGENDNKAAASKFSHELGTTMPESSMRTIKKSPFKSSRKNLILIRSRVSPMDLEDAH